MSLIIDLDPEVQKRLEQEAGQQGIDPGEFARRLIEAGLTAPLNARQQAVIDLLDAWMAEDATDAVEIQRAEGELEAFKQAMNENRAGERPLFP
jgi:hypothetical protein